MLSILSMFFLLLLTFSSLVHWVGSSVFHHYHKCSVSMLEIWSVVSHTNYVFNVETKRKKQAIEKLMLTYEKSECFLESASYVVYGLLKLAVSNTSAMLLDGWKEKNITKKMIVLCHRNILYIECDCSEKIHTHKHTNETNGSCSKFEDVCRRWDE